jgi:type II secretory pathway component PulJ
MAGYTLMPVSRALLMGVSFCLLLALSAPSCSESSLEMGWQEARIQQVQKARKQMNKQRQRKHELAAEKELKEMKGQKKEGRPEKGQN